MTQYLLITALGVAAWFCVGGAALASVGRGFKFAAARLPGQENPHANELMWLLRALGAWAWLTLRWPNTLARYFRGYGLLSGHIAAECPFRITAGGEQAKAWNQYRHGRDCRRKHRQHRRGRESA